MPLSPDLSSIPTCKFCHWLVGQRFGRLTVIRFAKRLKETAVWTVRCDCGREKDVRGSNLLTLSVATCGCSRKKPEKFQEVTSRPRQLPTGMAAFRRVFREYKTNAVRRGIEFMLTEPQCHRLFQSDCAYCGDACCSACNRAKGIMSYAQFMVWVRRIARFQGLVVGREIA